MNNTEEKFRQIILKNTGAYIKKMPDYKMMCSSGLRGLPDFLVIESGITRWYEVKDAKSNHTFNFNKIEDSQWIEFKKMYDAGAYIYFAVFFGKKFKVIDFEEIYNMKFELHKDKYLYN